MALSRLCAAGLASPAARRIRVDKWTLTSAGRNQKGDFVVSVRVSAPSFAPWTRE